MTKTPMASVYQVSFLLFLGLCLGFASRLCTATYDEEKEEQPLPQQPTSSSKDHIAYLEYIENFGCPPKTPKHLMDFSKKIGTRICWKKAAYLLQHPPSNQAEKVVSWTSLHANNEQDAPQSNTDNKGDDKETIMQKICAVDKKQVAPLQHELSTLKRAQTQETPKLIKTHKGQATFQQEIDEEDETLKHSVEPQGYQIAAALLHHWTKKTSPSYLLTYFT